VRVQLSLLLPVVVALIALYGRDLWLRYLLLLSVLLLHETAHALASLALGARRANVQIWPWFGRAEVESFPDRREALVALAAPVANLVLAGALWLAGSGLTLAPGRAPLPDLLLTANLLMGVGNLLPLRPVDGGRALHALRTR
jgi:stage IV sporulation protein FB